MQLNQVKPNGGREWVYVVLAALFVLSSRAVDIENGLTAAQWINTGVSMTIAALTALGGKRDNK